jgi:hypothetical protein
MRSRLVLPPSLCRKRRRRLSRSDAAKAMALK